MARQQLPPGIKKITVKNRRTGRDETRYEVTIDTGVNPATGNRAQSKRRCRTEKEARDLRATALADVARGTYVHRSAQSFGKACEDWLNSKLRIKQTTRTAYYQALQPAIDDLGHLPYQRLEKGHFVELVGKLRRGELFRTVGRFGEHRKTKRVLRKPWKAATVNYTLMVCEMVLEDLVLQGKLQRNVVRLVDRLPDEPYEYVTLTEAQVKKVFKAIERHPLRHAFVLAIHMLRRGEICGGRWTGVDFGNQIYKVSHTRVVTGGKVLDQETPKSDSSERDLPMSGMLDEALRRARGQQAADKAKWGGEYNDSGFIVVDEKGNPLHPEDFTYFWYCLLRSCGLPEIRLHDARHSLATILIRKGVDPAVVSAWLGHARVSFTMDTYVHTNPEDLRPAAKTLDRVVTFSDIKPSAAPTTEILPQAITPDQAA